MGSKSGVLFIEFLVLPCVLTFIEMPWLYLHMQSISDELVEFRGTIIQCPIVIWFKHQGINNNNADL